jgi:HSP20 family protein
MADTNTERRPEDRGRSLERRSQQGGGGGLARRGDMGFGFPGIFRRDPEELFSISPFTLMRRLTEDMDRMFSGWTGLAPETSLWAPPIEVREQNGNLVIAAELPGLSKDDVKIEVREGDLVIQGERKQEREEERGGIRRSERTYGAFYREIPLPEGAKIDQVKAQFNNGVLEVVIPVAEEQRKTRQIPIEAGTGMSTGQGSGTERKQAGSQSEKQPTQTSKAG